MSNTSIRPGYVPVTLELPADLAEKFHQQNYNWEKLVHLLVAEVSPSELQERLLDLYFDFTRLLLMVPEEFEQPGILQENLYQWQLLYRAIRWLEIPPLD